MKQQLQLQELAAQIVERSNSKADFVTDTRNIQMEDDGRTLTMGDRQLQIAPIFHEQTADRLDIPIRYYRKMASDKPELLARNVNTWLHDKPEVRMIRTLGDRARANLSDRYQRLDDDAFAQITLASIHEDSSSEIVACAITEEKTHIKYVSKRTQVDVKVGEPVQFGVAFSNSEVGRGRLSASLLIYTLSCLNGAVSSEDAFGQNHVGRRIETMGEIFALDTVNADAHATMLKLRDFTRHILSPERIQAYLDRARTLQGIQVANPMQAIKQLGSTFQFSEVEQTSILTHLIKGGDLSGFGLHNAVTAAAQDDALTYERAHEMEVIGGKILTLAPSQWRTITEAERIAA